MIVAINFAAIDAVEPLSYVGLSSTMSAATIFLFCNVVIKSYYSLHEIPTASGLPTPGANAGSNTSKSILT